jgi:hypothetical protein
LILYIIGPIDLSGLEVGTYMTLTKKSIRLLLPVSFLLAVASPAFSQGISEGMGMMGMPKPVPGVNAGMYDKMFNAPHRVTERAISQSGTPAPSARAKSKTANGGAKPTGAAITSGDVNVDPQAAKRAAIAKQSALATDLYKKAVEAETKGKLPDAVRYYAGSVAIKGHTGPNRTRPFLRFSTRWLFSTPRLEMLLLQ